MSFAFTEWLNDDGGETFPVRVDVESDEYGALDEWRVILELDGVDVDISNRLTDTERTEIDERSQRELTAHRIESIMEQRRYDGIAGYTGAVWK